MSRCKLVGSLGVGIAAAAMPATSQAQSPTNQTMADPTTKYPKPPYTIAFQPWLGVASKMTPPPDHGEISYKGSGRPLNREALITGGDSGMDRAAAIAYARKGADVAINYLPAEEPDVAHYSVAHGCRHFRATVQEARKVGRFLGTNA